MIEWEVNEKMGRYLKWIFNIFLFLLLMFVILLLTILIIYIVNNSFKSSATILAGCIGFVGAIIGGVITLQGVKYTIDNTNKIRELDAIPGKIEKINKFRTSLNEILEISSVDSNGENRAYLSAKGVLDYIWELKLITETISINETIYNEFIGLVSYAQDIMCENLCTEDNYKTYSSFQERLKSMIDGLNKTLEKEAMTFTQVYFNS